MSPPQGLSSVGHGLVQEVDLEHVDVVVTHQAQAEVGDVITDLRVPGVKDVTAEVVLPVGRVRVQVRKARAALPQEQGRHPQGHRGAGGVDGLDRARQVGELRGVRQPVGAALIATSLCEPLPAVVDEDRPAAELGRENCLAGDEFGVDVLMS